MTDPYSHLEAVKHQYEHCQQDGCYEPTMGIYARYCRVHCYARIQRGHGCNKGKRKYPKIDRAERLKVRLATKYDERAWYRDREYPQYAISAPGW